MTERNHALLILEEDTTDEPELYQVTKVDHGPDTPQFRLVRQAHEELLAEVRDDRDDKPWRLVEEWYADEDTAEMHYEMHEKKLGVAA